jgi:hypothetical protein
MTSLEAENQSGAPHDDKISYEQPPHWPEEMDRYYADQLKSDLEWPTREAAFVSHFKVVLGDKVLTAREKIKSIKGLMALYESNK